MALRVRSRRSWGAKPPESRSGFSTPARYTFIHHTVTSFPAGEKAAVRQEKEHMRYLQQIAFGRDFADISYSFVIFPSGRVYEGRGWRVVGAHTDGSNSISHAFVFVGNYELDRPTKAALEAAAKLHKRGRRQGHIDPRAQILGHRQASGAATACPGTHLFHKLQAIREMAR